MNEQEREINLKRLFYKACRNWRVAVVTALVGATLIGGTKCTTEFIKVSDPEVVEARQTEYEGELALHEQKGEAIQKDIERLESSIVQQEDYNKNSVLMKIDPYNEWFCRLLCGNRLEDFAGDEHPEPESGKADCKRV